MCSWFCFSSFNMYVDKWGTYKYILINRWQLCVTCEVLEYTTWFWENLKLLNLWQQLSSFSLKLLLPSTVCLTVFFFFHSATSIPSTFSSSSSSDSCDHSIPSMCSKSTSSWTASTSKEKKVWPSSNRCFHTTTIYLCTLKHSKNQQYQFKSTI